MDFVGMVIEVNGLPDYPSSKSSSMIDKLTLHFLRRSNSGEDVLTVIYPTSIKGQAFVVFESPEVPGVLQHTHVLEVDGRFYALDVKRGYHQLDMPAEAWLDASMFSRPKEIRDLLHRFGFGVSETSSGQLHVQGSFLKLKVIRPKLMQLLAQETCTRRRTSSPNDSGYFNGSASNYGFSDLESTNGSTLRHTHINGRSVYDGDRSPYKVTTSGSPEFYKNQSLSRTDSPADGCYSTQDSFSIPKSKNLAFAKHTETSFPVDADVYRYTMSFKRNGVKTIESKHRTQINHEGDSDHLTVKLSGGACEEAAKDLSYFLQEITSSLCTQQIDLDELDSSHQKQISQNVDMIQKQYTVLITQAANILQIVGTSNNSYEGMQEILRLKRSIPLPSNLSRSSSLQRHTKTRKDNVDLRQNPDTVLQTSSHSASRHQTDSSSQQASPQERGRPLIKSHMLQRAQSADSRHKNKNIENNPVPPLDQQDLSPSSRSKKGQSPNFLKSLLPNASFPKFHKKSK